MRTLMPTESRRSAARLLVVTVMLVFIGCGSTAGRAGPVAAGSGSVAEGEELRNTNAARAEELLQGRFPGVRVFRRADGSLSVQIRGESSPGAGREPLYVVDGIVIDDAGSGGLTGINPNEIERIEVLKDIGSTSFYGVRGAHGVILITLREREQRRP